MNVGSISPDKEVSFRLTVRGLNNRERDVEALLDTGFNGYLALPTRWIRELRLDNIGQAQMVLASGEVRRVQKHEAIALFGNVSRPVEVVEAAEPLVGTELLWGYGLRVDFEIGGRVEVDALP